MKNNFYILITLVALFASCTSYKKHLYFQGVQRNGEQGYPINNFFAPTIQYGDLLAVNVKSLNTDGSAIFNTGVPSAGEKGSGSGGSGQSMGYQVDKDGNIVLPLVNKIKVGGRTLTEAQMLIKQAISPILKDPEVIITIMNFKVSVFGDVASPNTYSIADERFSIPQALSLAGDLTPTANPANILLIREVDGQRKYINIDMTSPGLFESKYYYLKSNDILYIEPTKAKFAAQSQTTRVLPIVLSALSLILASYQLTK